MNDVERELRRGFARTERHLVGPEFAPPGLPLELRRRTHRRQVTIVAAGIVTALAVVAVSVAGATLLLRSSERKIPAEPPALTPGRLQAVPMGTALQSLTGPGPVTAVDADEAWVNSWSDGVWRVDGGIWTRHSGLGLPTEVHDLALADDGTLWAATEGGLARFDGSRWEGVEVGKHTAIAFGPDGGVWTASGIGGNATVERVGGSALPGPIPFIGEVTSLEVRSEDDVWAGAWGWNAGLAHFDGRTWTAVEPIEGDEEFGLNDIEVAPNGNVWVSLVNWDLEEPSAPDPIVVARFDGSSWEAYHRDANGVPFGTLQSLTGKLDHMLDLMPDGTPVLAAGSGLLAFRDGAWTLLQGGSFRNLSVAPDGTIWLSGDGLFRFQPA